MTMTASLAGVPALFRYSLVFLLDDGDADTLGDYVAATANEAAEAAAIAHGVDAGRIAVLAKVAESPLDMEKATMTPPDDQPRPTAAERQRKSREQRARVGGEMVQAWLTAEAADKLRRWVERDGGTKSDAINRLLIRSRP